ncbi:MAG: hypothetical protein Q9170_006537 [Blastenia crenularia]
MSQTVQKPGTAELPFLKFPLEIRQQIYGLDVPSLDVPASQSDVWAWADGTTVESLSLFRVNKQISDEALEVYYRSMALTIAISCQTPDILRALGHGGWNPPIQSYPRSSAMSTQYIKHCQITLCTDLYLKPILESFTPHVKERIHAATVSMSQLFDLRTLKVSFGCLCHTMWDVSKILFEGCNCTVDNIRMAISSALEPLRRLRVKDGVSFIATDLWDPCQYELTARDADFPYLTLEEYELDELTQMHDWHYRDHYEEVKERMKPSANTQCQRPECLAFVGSFAELKADIKNNTAPNEL